MENREKMRNLMKRFRKPDETIEVQYEITANASYKTMIHRSRKRKKNHMVIVAEFSDKESAEIFKREMKKAIRKENHLLNEGLSYEMHINF